MTALPANTCNKDNKVRKIAKGVKKVGQDDPRRVIHSLKMGLALTLVSFLYYLRPLYDGFGVSGIWAVLTVVVVFEFTVGATLSKSINRGCGTVVAAGLGVGAQHLASLCGERGEPVIIGLLVFVLAAAATFTRFFPKIKERYDYGVSIFILTFSLVAVSGYRVEDIIVLGYQRLLTILIGNAICMVVSIFVCPVWAGQDLHKLTGNNLDSLASFLEGFGDDYFKVVDGKDAGDDRPTFLHKYRNVLTSQHTEDTLANFARWEPGHGRFRLSHPWKQYQRVGALIRQCAYRVDALTTGYINSDIKASSEFRGKIEGPCRRMSAETSKALKAMSAAIKTMSLPKTADSHVCNAKEAVKELEITLKQVAVLLYGTHQSKSKEDDHDHDNNILLLSIIPDVTVASILTSIVQCVEDIAEATHQLAESACFRAVEPTVSPADVEPAPQHVFHRGIVKPVECDHHVGRVSIMVHDPAVPTGKTEAVGEAVGRDHYDQSCTDYEKNVEGCGIVHTTSMQQQQHVITVPS